MATAKEYWQLQGATGNSGSDGSDGSDGSNGYTDTTASFTMPAENSTVVVSVSDSSWASIGQVVYVEGAGYMEVTARPASTQVTLKNIESTASSSYTSNSAPGTVVASGKRVSPAGLQGPSGAAGSSGADADAYYMVTTASDAPTNAVDLGLLSTGLLKITVADSAATPSAVELSAFAETILNDANAAAVRTTLGLDSMSTQASSSVSISGGAIAGITDLAVADGGTGSSTAAGARTNLGAAASGANSDITSLSGLTTALTVAQGGTGVDALPSFSVNLNGTDQSAVVTATPTKLAFATKVFDTETYFDTSTNRFTPLKAGKYAFTVAAQVNALAATGDIVQVHLYKNGTKVATGKAVAPDAADNVQAMVHFVAAANGSTDYFEAYVEHDAGANKDVEGDEEVTFFCGNWCGE